MKNQVLDDFGELKYITNAKERIVWHDTLEPRIMLQKYLDGMPLRAIATEHGRSIDQMRDFAAKLKQGIVTPATHFATMGGQVVWPDAVLEEINPLLFRDGTPQSRALALYKVPGLTCYICATTGAFYSEMPDLDYPEGDCMGLEGDSFYTTPCGTISASAAFKRTFWDQPTKHSMAIFNHQILSNIAPWARDYTVPSLEIRKYIAEVPTILEDLFYVKDNVLQCFIPDLLVKSTKFDGHTVTLKCRGAKISYDIPAAIIPLSIIMDTLQKV